MIEKPEATPITSGMPRRPRALTRPDRMTVWPMADDQVGLDIRWGGRFGVRRATAAHERLRLEGHPVSLVQDELGWRLRLSPLDPSRIGEIAGKLFVAP